MRVLFISGDCDHRVHAREWKIPKRKDIDWDYEFEKCLEHYESNGHAVQREFGEFAESRIMTLEFNGYLGFIEE